MTDVVCQVSNQASQVEMIWSARGGFFRPYVITGPQLVELRQAASKARDALQDMVYDLNAAGDRPVPWESSYELAVAGARLFNCLMPGEDETAGKVARWLEDLRADEGLISLEVVVEEQSSDPKAVLSIPWNLVYDDLADTYQAEFETGQGAERWRPFWGVRYNLTCGRRVEPWRRLPTWSDPRVVVVIDPTVYEGLHDDQRQRLDAFLAGAKVPRLGSLNELKKALNAGYPRLLYWLGHASPDYLQLGDERIAPADLRNLLRSYSRRERPEGMLAFLNACQTGETGDKGSFLEVLHTFGFTGAIATEQQTIDNFANEFGLAFLEGFLHQGKPLGELLHGLRLERAPLGLLYGAHCPPEIRVRVGPADEATALPEIRETTAAPGVSLGVAAAAPTLGPAATRIPTLPEQPYPSLAYYDHADRLLFTGRDTDIVRFSATLDLPDTRILVLHGESGLGKSSFLRAGVIPYLEEQCAGYRFLRGPDGRPVIVQAANDPVGRLAQALLDMTARPVVYPSPTGESLTFDLRPVLDEALGAPADLPGLRAALLADAGLLAELLKRLADGLPHALVLVLDQAEELFTLARTDEEVAWRDQALRLLQRVADVPSDVKVIVILRTEYYGRLLDHLREGRHDLVGVRDDLLRDFSKEALVEAIERPTLETPLAVGQASPRQKYGFRYAEGMAGTIAAGVLALRSENQDSALPLMQVLCTRLYLNEVTDPNSDRVVTPDDLAAIGGVDGGLRSFAEDAMERSMGLGPEDREAFRTLYTQLYTRQADGTLTTWLAPRETLETSWSGEKPLDEVLEAARRVRLLRVDELRIEGERPRSYVRLGHDALAKVAAAWKAQREIQERLKKERRRRMVLIGWLAGISLLATVFAYEVYRASRAEHEAKNQAVIARSAEERAKKQEAQAESQRQIAEEATNQARTQARIATSRQLAALSASERNKRLDLSLLLAVEAIRTENTFEARDSLYKTFQDRSGLISFLHVGSVGVVAFSPDGKTLAAGYDGGVVLWDVAGRPRPTETLLPVKEGRVLSVAFSPDSMTLAAGYNGGMVLWNVAERQRRAEIPLPVNEDVVSSMSFSPDGKTLAAGYDGGVVLWDVAGRPREAAATLPVEEGDVSSVAFSPDGKILAAGYIVDGLEGTVGVDGGVVLWNVAGRQRMVKDSLPVNEGRVRSVAFSPDGKTLAAGYSGVDVGEKVFATDYSVGDGGVVLWDVAGRERRAEAPLPVKEGFVWSVAFSPDGETRAAGYSVDGDRDGGGMVLLRDEAGRLHRFPFKEGRVWSVALSPDGKTLAAGYDGGVVLWDVAGRPRLAEELFPKKEPNVSGAASIRRRRPRPVHEGEGYVLSVAFSPDGEALAAGYGGGPGGYIGGPGGGGYEMWDVAGHRRLAKDPLPVKEGKVNGVAFSPDGKTLAAGYSGRALGVDFDSGVVLRDVAGRPHLEADPLPVKEGDVQNVAFSPDGKTLAAGYSRVGHGGVVLWDVVQRQRLAADPLPVMEGYVQSVAFSPDGKTLAAGYSGDGGGVVLWDVAARRRLTEEPLPVEEGYVRSVAFSPDGKTLAAGYTTLSVGGVVLWDVVKRTRLTEEPLPVRGKVNGVAFSPDSKTLAAGYGDVAGPGGVVLWDVVQRQRLAADPLPVKEGGVSSVAYRPNGKTLPPDGKTLAVGFRDFVNGGVMLWDGDLKSWRHRAAEIANRNFTRDEWRTFFPDKPYRRTIRSLPWPHDLPEGERTQAEAWEKEHPEEEDAS